MGRMNGEVCLITGAARGQGAAEARLFVAEGATVWMSDVLDSEGETLAGEIGATYRRLDVRNEVAWSSLVAEILGRDGKIDVLINNAGIFRAGRHFEISLEHFEEIHHWFFSNRSRTNFIRPLRRAMALAPSEPVIFLNSSPSSQQATSGC